MWSCHSTVEARSHGSLASSLSEWGEVTRPSRREQPRSLTSFTYLGCYLPVSMSVVRGKWWEGDGLGFLFPSLIVTYAQPIIITFLPIISRSLRSLLMMKDMIMWRGSRGSSFTLEPRARSLHSRSLHEWDESGVVGSLRFPRSTTPLAFGSLKIKEKNARPFAPLRCLYGKGLEPVLYPRNEGCDKEPKTQIPITWLTLDQPVPWFTRLNSQTKDYH